MSNKRGFTLIEVLLSITLSAGVIAILTVIPNRMFQSYMGYMDEVQFNQGSNAIVLAINEDLSQSFLAEENATGFTIGEHVYRFTEEGLFRQSGDSTVLLSGLPLDFKIGTQDLQIFNSDHLERKTENKTNISLTFPIQNSSFLIEGGVQ